MASQNVPPLRASTSVSRGASIFRHSLALRRHSTASRPSLAAPLSARAARRAEASRALRAEESRLIRTPTDSLISVRDQTRAVFRPRRSEPILEARKNPFRCREVKFRSRKKARPNNSLNRNWRQKKNPFQNSFSGRKRILGRTLCPSTRLRNLQGLDRNIRLREFPFSTVPFLRNETP